MSSKASVAIIGGGIIGASIAYNLAKKGAKGVVVLEKSKFGSGSTSASLGGFRHQFSNELSIQLSKESIKIIEGFKELTGYDPLAKKDGYLFIASREESFFQLKRNRELALAHGIPVDLLEERELQEKFPFYRFEGILGGTLCMEDGHASTLAVLQGYISKSRELGAELYENTEVRALRKTADPRSIEVSTDRGEMTVDKVVIAAGAYSALVGNLAGVKIPIKPYPRKILITHSFHKGIPVAIPLIIDVDSTLGFGREGRGILMADNGPNVPSFDLVFPPEYDERVVSMALKRVPALSEASVAYSNMGLYEMTPDANPIVSEVEDFPGLYCCAGFGGHGFMHAPVIGELMSELLLDQKPHLEISKFHLKRFTSNETSSKEQLII